MAKNISEEIDFYQYVDGVKQRKLSWKLFIALMQDLSYKNINRLRKLNAIILTELTMNYSDLDKFKYLNEILMIQFKNFIEREDANFKITENDQHNYTENSHVDQISNEDETFEERIKEISTNKDIQMQIGHENSDSTTTYKEEIIEYNPQNTEFEITEMF